MRVIIKPFIDDITRWREDMSFIRLCHTAAILSQKTKKALFYHAEPRSQNCGGEARRGKTKLFWSPGTIWPPCDKGECASGKNNINSCLRPNV